MNSHIQRKFFYAFGTLIALILIVGGLNYFTMKNTTAEYSELLEHEVNQINLLDEILVIQGQIATDIRGFIIFKNESFIDLVHEKEALREETLTQLKALTEEMEIDGAVEQLETLQAQVDEYEQLTLTMLETARTGGVEDIQRVGQNMNKRYEAIMDQTEAIKTESVQILNETDQQLTKSTQTAIFWNAILIIGSAIVGLTIAYVVGRNIANPIRTLTNHMHEMANGNLRLSPLPIKGNDEIAQMSTSFNEMLTSWKNLLYRMRDSSNELAAQSEQLSASSEESLASSEIVASSAEQNMENSERQAGYIEQTAQAVNEVSHGIEDISRSNEEMLTSAADMSDSVQNGMNVIRDVSTHMTEIDATIQQSTNMMENMAKKSAEIQEVSSLITNISEQTNLLALNAAIEAARAGEHGAGFAVVANEVRHLAEESHQSAAKIEEMIADVSNASQQAVESILAGQAKVSDGLTRTQDSLVVFNEIESSVRTVNDVISTISAAIEEIQAMTESVTTNSNNLRDLAEQSANGAQETGAATEEQLAAMQEITSSTEALAKLAEDLQDEIQRFQL